MIKLQIILVLVVLVSVAFFTLFERKLLGYMQNRKGPNKLFVKGVMQPFSDGLKLMMKDNFNSLSFNYYYYMIFPLMMMMMMMMMWMLFIFLKMEMMNLSILYFVVISGFSVYTLVGSGWVSNSKYALLGAYRSMCQVVSYEVGLVFLFMYIFLIVKIYSLNVLENKNLVSHNLFYGNVFVFLMWLSIMMAELNRAPFDFAESESELVSGFNVEFGSIKFVFMFLAEYGSMLFMSYLSMSLFFFKSEVIILLLVTVLVWVRGTFPRFRYDNLMYMNWKVYLPVILYLFVGFYFLKEIWGCE